MVTGTKISRALIYVLLGVALRASSHWTVEATAPHNNRSSRRLPSQRIRGSQRGREIISNDTARHLKGDGETTGSEPYFGKVTRRVPLKVGNLSLALGKAKASTKKEGALPEPQGPQQSKQSEQAIQIKVNKKSEGNSGKDGASYRPKGGDRFKHGKHKDVVENGLEHFQEVDVEVYRREVPSFSMKFTVEDPTNVPNLADYNELSDISEEYLNNFFESVFEDVQVRHRDTILFLMASEDDPYDLEFRMQLEFIIPGEVPTINYLLDRLQNGLASQTPESPTSYLSYLKKMSETNPFSKTISFQVTSRPPVSAAEMGLGGGKQPTVGSIESVGNKHVLISVLAGMGCIALVIAGVMWKKKKFHQGAEPESNQSFSLFDKSNKKNASTNAKSPSLYGADEETMNYLNSIRKRYRDHDGKKKLSSSNEKNIAAIEETGSYDDGDDSMCDTVETGSDNGKKDIDVEEDLRSIY